MLMVRVTGHQRTWASCRLEVGGIAVQGESLGVGLGSCCFLEALLYECRDLPRGRHTERGAWHGTWVPISFKMYEGG